MVQFNLRQRMIAGFILQLLFFIGIGVQFYRDFDMFNNHVRLLVHVNKLSNLSLEIRRYEKNFIIRHDAEDYHIAEAYIKEALDYLPQAVAASQHLPDPYHLQQFTALLKEYQVAFLAMDKQADCLDSGDTLCDQVKVKGRELVRISDAFIADQQSKMFDFIRSAKLQLFIYLMLLVSFSIITSFLVYRYVVTPLKNIEKAANSISLGTFSPFTISDHQDEAQSVLSAFNKMVANIEIQQEQLFQEKKLASLGTLASGTAHQLNNPLNNISTSSQIAQAELDEGNADFAKKLLQTIDEEAMRAGEIVRGLLEYSREQEFMIKPVHLVGVVNRAIRLVSNEVPSGTRIENLVSEEIILPLDAQKMTEAFLNLLINAIQSIIPPGTVSVSAAVQEDRNRVLIRFRDSGRGIDSSALPYVFDPFFTTKSEGEGTGLGLAVVSSIVTKHGGTIRVESQKGMGTLFIISLPMKPETI